MVFLKSQLFFTKFIKKPTLFSDMAERVLVSKKSALPEGKMIAVEAKGRNVLLTNIGGEIFAMDAICSHKGGPLCEGVLEEHTVTCPWHSAKFDVRTGKVSEQTPWAFDQQKYSVTVEGDDIYVEI